MSQAAVILPGSPLTGSAAATDINAAWAAIISKFSGNSAPTLGPGASSALVKGQDWLNTTSNPNVWSVYDGTSWCSLATINTSTHVINISVGGTIAAVGSLTISKTSATAEIIVVNTGSNNPAIRIYDTTDGGGTIFSAGGTFRIASLNSSGSFVANMLSITSAGVVGVLASIASTSTTTGALTVAGGAGIVGQLNVGGANNRINGTLSIYNAAVGGYPLDVGGGSGGLIARLNGGASGAGSGAALFMSNGGSGVGGFGNLSVFTGGAYSTTMLFYSNAALLFSAGATTNTHLTIDAAGNTVVGSAALATNATNGFFYIPTCAGAPTGDSTDFTGRLPMVYDTTNNKLWFNTSGSTWKGVVLA